MMFLALPSAKAGEWPPYYDVFAEIDVNGIYRSFKGHKAFALGMNNYGWFAYGYRSLRDARMAALNGCVSNVRKKLSIKGDPKCKLVMENKKFVWPQPRPKPLNQNFLPQPDLPLAKSHIFGEIKSAKAILLAVHGCDGTGDPNNPWSVEWRNFFIAKGFVVIQPDSFADKREVVCGFNIEAKRSDPVLRLRVAQTLRSISTLQKRFPRKPIYLWGHSEGGLVVQLTNYEVRGIVVTGADCILSALSPRKPVLHVFGGKDSHTALGDKTTPLTETKVRKTCKNYSKKGRQRFVIVPDGNHWVSSSNPAVAPGLDYLLKQ